MRVQELYLTLVSLRVRGGELQGVFEAVKGGDEVRVAFVNGGLESVQKGVHGWWEVAESGTLCLVHVLQCLIDFST